MKAVDIVPAKKCIPDSPVGKWMGNGRSISLSTPKEFSFSECLKFLARSSDECLHLIENDKIYKLIKIDGEIILLQISHKDWDLIHIGFLNFYPKKSARLAAVRYVSEWFDLETDVTPFYLMAKKDNILKNLVRDYYGLRLIGISDLFEAVGWAIIGQQINLSFAYTLKKRFVESFGEKLVYDNKVYWLFPTPEDISDISITDLMSLQFTRKKSEYIIELVNKMKKGVVSKEILLENDDIEFQRRELLKILGVGRWTANYVLMRCLRNPSAFPIDDVGLHNAIKQQLNLSHKPTINEVGKLSAHWTNWEAYATFYLWRSLI